MKQRADSVRVAYPLFQEDGGGSTPTSALDFQIEQVNTRTAQQLNRSWHSVLPDTHLGNMKGSKYAVCYGAEFCGVMYAVAMWTHPIAANRMSDSDTTIELRRLAIADDAPKNTASRMLSVMARLLRKRWPELTRMISYQAVSHHAGTIYKASGWTPIYSTGFMEWKDRKNSTRREPQTKSDKICWERKL